MGVRLRSVQYGPGQAAAKLGRRRCCWLLREAGVAMVIQCLEECLLKLAGRELREEPPLDVL
jgi:hypothetical protein